MKIKVIYCEKEVVYAYRSYYTNTAAILKNNINLSESDKHIILIPDIQLSAETGENYEPRMKEFATHFKKAKRLTRHNFATETLKPSSPSDDDYIIIDAMNQLARDCPDKEIEFQLYTRYNSFLTPKFLQNNSANIPANITIKLYQSKDPDHYIDKISPITIQGTGLINIKNVKELDKLTNGSALDSLLFKLKEALPVNGEVFARGILLKTALITQQRYVELSQLSCLNDFIESIIALLQRRVTLSSEKQLIIEQILQQSLHVLEDMNTVHSLKHYVGFKIPRHFSSQDGALTVDLLKKINRYFEDSSEENKQQILVATHNLYQSHNKNPLAALGFILLGILLTCCPMMAIAPILFGAVATIYAPLLIASLITTSATGIALLVASNQVMKAENYKEDIKKSLYESANSIAAVQGITLFGGDKFISNDEQVLHSLRNK
ncbi:MAG: hypothetical protein J0I93_04000 [Legionella sp.]|nr:hypothetical protein [Legionella sp.]